MNDALYRKQIRRLMDIVVPTPKATDLPAIMGLTAPEMIEFVSLGAMLPVNRIDRPEANGA